jgi:hypothetical protein
MDQSQVEVPDEFRSLGEFRQAFRTTPGAVATSLLRCIPPLALGGGLVALAEYWIVERNWKYYLALVPGVLLGAQAVRVFVRTLLRLRQKVLIFEKGIVVYRSGRMDVYRWDQVEQVEAVVAQAQGAPSSFLSFSFQGRTDEGETRTHNFHPAGDPIPNIKELWQIVEEEAGRGRAAGAIAKVKACEEVTFQRTIWGKVVSTQIGVSLFGIRAKPRYDPDRFLDWSRVDRIAVVDRPTAPREQGYTTGGIPHLEIHQPFDRKAWVSELTSEIPGYQALLEAAEFALGRYRETLAALHRDRFPAALAVIESGQEFRLGKFGVSRNGFRYDAETFLWDDLGGLRFDKEEVVAPKLGDRTFPYDDLTLEDRWLLHLLELRVHYGDEDPDDDEGDDDDENDEDDDDNEEDGGSPKNERG